MARLISDELRWRETTRHLDRDTRSEVMRALGAPWPIPFVGSDPDRVWTRTEGPSGALDLTLWLRSEWMGFMADGI
jgi:hypothetical protein